MDHKQVASYWYKTAAHDIKVMRSLFNNGHYSDALFYGQLVLEKLLKAKGVYFYRPDAVTDFSTSNRTNLIPLVGGQEVAGG